MFQINDKVVCVKGGFPTNSNTSLRALVEGMIYVVCDVDPPRWVGDTWGCRVTGCPTFCESGREVFWNVARFRKLSDIQTENRMKQSEQISI